MDEFTRPFTVEEFDTRFHETGYPDDARQYCYDSWIGMFNSHLRLEISRLNLPDLPATIAFLKEECSWSADTVREQAWNDVMKHCDVDEYMSQRRDGHGHEWAKAFCDKLEVHDIFSEDVDIVKIYGETYHELCDNLKTNDKRPVNDSQEKDCLADKELHIAAKKLANGESEIVENYIADKIKSEYDGTAYDLYFEAVNFKRLYESILNEGFDKKTALEHAENMLYSQYPEYFNKIYREAMSRHETPSAAFDLADFCTGAIVNGRQILEINDFKKHFTEPWQRELFARIVIDDVIKTDGGISTLHENDIRTSLDLCPINKPLSHEDQEFIRLKAKYIDDGLNEYLAEQRAYKEVYESDCDVYTPADNRNRDFNHDMLQMMFPNDDADAEDFEDGLDMEDFSRD